MPKPNPHGVTGLQRKNGWWIFEWRWTDPTTGQKHKLRRIPDRSLTDAQVKEWARRLKAGVLTGRVSAKRASAPSLPRALYHYLRHCATINEPSTQKRKKMQARVIERELGDLRLDQITYATVDKFRMRLRRNGRSVATVNRYLAFLKHMASWALERGWMEEAQVAAIRRIRQTREPRPHPRCLTEEEEARLLRGCDQELRPVVVVALDTGLRMGELIALKWRDVDWRRWKLIVRQSKSKVARRVRLTKRAYHALLRLHMVRKTGHVFLSWDGEPWTADRLHNAFQTAKARSGVSCRFHSLRSTFATRYIEIGGGSTYQLKEALGHETLAMSQHYVDGTSVNTDGPIEAMDGAGADES